MKRFKSIEKWPFFYGIIIALVGTIGVLVSVPGQTVGVSTFTNPLKEALGLTRGQISLAYTFGTVGSSFMLGIAGRYFDQYGARVVATIAAFGLAVSLTISASSSFISDVLKEMLHTDTSLISFIVIMMCFFLIRFSGQGVLTLSSRNMIMLWFDQYRGRVNAFSCIAVSLGFSISPLWINFLIEDFSWQHAWYIMAISLFIISGFIFVTFRDAPEKYGLKPDGFLVIKKKASVVPKEVKQFTRHEALRTRAFWIYSLVLSFNGYFVTGLTFHIESIFKTVGYTKQEALSYFLPMSIISVIASVLFNSLSDKIKLKYILYVMIFGSLLCSLGLGFLQIRSGFYLLVVGAGIMSGIYAVLSSVAWPRFFGRKHLGAISGVNMQMMVFSSALGPYLFSLSYSWFNSYSVIAFAGIAGLAILAIGAIKADNPQ